MNGSGASGGGWSRIIIIVGRIHQRLADLEAHFQTLAQTPAEVLRQIGSPFAPDKQTPVPLLPAA